MADEVAKDERENKKPSEKGKHDLGVLIALLGAAMGQSYVSQYGFQADASPEKILNDKDVRACLDYEPKEKRYEDSI